MAATIFDDVLDYDPTTSAGRVRALLGDTVQSAKVWAEQEITAALTYMGDNAELAAAWLLEGAAADAAKCAIIQSNDQFKTDLSKIPGELRAQAARLRSIAVVAPVVGDNVPDAVFTATSGAGTVPGTMDLW